MCWSFSAPAKTVLCRNYLPVYALLVYFSFALFLIIPFFPQEFPDHRLSGNMNRPEHHRTTSMSKGALFRKKKLWAQSTGAGAAKTKGTTISQFKTSLEELIQALVDTNPYFVRCIKSNTRQTPQEFDTEYVRRQLKYLGVVETVRIRKLGYSVRLSFEEFAFRYQKLRPRDSVVMDHRQESVEILNSCKLDQRSYQLGKTKVFLKEGAAIYLEKCVKCLQVWAAHQIITAVKILSPYLLFIFLGGLTCCCTSIVSSTGTTRGLCGKRRKKSVEDRKSG